MNSETDLKQPENQKHEYKWSKTFIYASSIIISILFMFSYAISLHAAELPDGGEKVLLGFMASFSLLPNLVILFWFASLLIFSVPSEKTAAWMKTPRSTKEVVTHDSSNGSPGKE